MGDACGYSFKLLEENKVQVTVIQCDPVKACNGLLSESWLIYKKPNLKNEKKGNEEKL